jgi:hypothetical protein
MATVALTKPNTRVPHGFALRAYALGTALSAPAYNPCCLMSRGGVGSYECATGFF